MIVTTIKDLKLMFLQEDILLKKVSPSKELKFFLDNSSCDYLTGLINEIFESNKNKKFPGGMSNWVCQLKIISFMPQKSLIKVSKSKNLPIRFHIKILEDGFYDSHKIFDTVMLDNGYDNNIRIYCAKKCSLDSLKSAINDKEFKIRKICYDRLGPEYCLPFMIKDSKSEAREAAVSFIPASSIELRKFVDDPSSSVLLKVINKISINELPYFLGNKKIMKSKKLTDLIKERLYEDV